MVLALLQVLYPSVSQFEGLIAFLETIIHRERSRFYLSSMDSLINIYVWGSDIRLLEPQQWS